MNKLPNECFKCRNRFCHFQILRNEDPKFNEVACDKHHEDLCAYADEVLGGSGSGVYRTHRTSTGCVSRKDKEDYRD